MADDAFTALWDSKTGETVYLDDGLISGMRNEELENLLETVVGINAALSAR